MIKYLAEPSQFDSYLPTAQAMIDSFQPSIQQQITGVPQAKILQKEKGLKEICGLSNLALLHQ